MARSFGHIVPLVVLVWLGPLLLHARADDSPSTALVSGDHADVFERAGDRGVVAGRLPRGAQVTVLGQAGEGWLKIGAPPGSFDWILSTDIETTEESRAWVKRDGALTRLGREGARLPGPTGVELRAGTQVFLVDRPPLVLKRGDGHQTWIAIEPPVWEPRYLRADSVQALPRSRSRPKSAGQPVDRETVRAAVPQDPDIPPSLAQELSLADALHQSTLRDPLASWNLEPVRKRYEDLRRQESSPRGREILDRRIAEVEAEADAARAAAEFERLIGTSRLRDAEVESIRQLIQSVRVEADRRYKAKGLLQPSSKRLDGLKIPVLISDEGKILAYLQVPVGLDVPNLIGRKVGVNGSVRFEESIGARLIIVRDIEPIDEPE